MTEISAILAEQSYADGAAAVARTAAENSSRALIQAQINQLTGSLTGAVPYDPSEAISLVGSQRVHWSGIYELTAATPGGLAPLGSGDGSVSDQALLVSRVSGHAAAAGCNGGQGGTVRVVTNATDDAAGTTTGSLRYHLKAHQTAWELDHTARSWIIFDKGISVYNITLAADLLILARNLTVDARGVQVNISGGGAPGQIPYGTVASGGAPSGGTVITLNTGLNFGGARLKVGAILDITDGTRSNVYATNRIVAAFDAAAKTITLDASTPIPAGVPTGATLVLAGKVTGTKGRTIGFGGIDWNDKFGPTKVNIPAGNIIWHNIGLISNWGGDVLDTGSAQDVVLRNWTDTIWFDHCSFTNPDPFHDVLFNIGRGAWNLTVSWCKFYDHYKAANHFGGVNGSGGLNPDGTTSSTHSFPPGYTVDNPGPYRFYDPKGKPSHGNENGLPFTIETATWHHCWLSRLGQRAPKVDNYAEVHIYNLLVTHWGTKTDPLTLNTITFPVPGDSPTGGAATQVINSGKLLLENSIYDPFPLATGGALRAVLRSANGSTNGCLKTVGNVYRGGSAPDSDINSSLVPDFSTRYPYTVDAVDTLLETRIMLGSGSGTQSALWTYIGPATIDASGAPDASATVKGIHKLAGDLGGTADLPTVPGLAGKAAASHTHAASDIASGTIATARLGSGTADSTKTLYGDGTWKAAASAGAVVPGQLIAHAGYWPVGSQTSATTTSTTQSDIAAAGVTAGWGSDAVGAFTSTRLDCTFTVPPSGIVEYEVSGFLKGSASGTAIRVAIGDNTGTQIAGPVNSGVILTGTAQQRVTTGRRRLDLSTITGGGPAVGSTFTLRPQWNVNSGTATVDVGGTNGNISMRVYVGM